MNTRDKILSAAEKVFSKNGYYMATMDMIASEAEVAKGTLYYNFPSKVTLFTEVIREGLKYLSRNLTDIAYNEYSPDMQVLKCIDFFVDYAVENSSFMFILFNELSGGIDKDALSTAKELINDLAKIIRDILQEGMNYSIVRYMDPNIAAYALLGAFQGVMGNYMKNSETVDIKKIKDNLGTLFMKGLLYR